MAIMKPRDVEQKKEALGVSEARLGFSGKQIPRKKCGQVPVVLVPSDPESQSSYPDSRSG